MNFLKQRKPWIWLAIFIVFMTGAGVILHSALIMVVDLIMFFFELAVSIYQNVIS